MQLKKVLKCIYNLVNPLTLLESKQFNYRRIKMGDSEALQCTLKGFIG